MQQTLILKQEEPKASLEEAAVLFWGLCHPGLHALHATSLHHLHHSLGAICGCYCFGGKRDCVRYHALTLRQAQPTATMEEAGVALSEQLTFCTLPLKDLSTNINRSKVGCAGN